jgi:hypothetical protein
VVKSWIVAVSFPAVTFTALSTKPNHYDIYDTQRFYLHIDDIHFFFAFTTSVNGLASIALAFFTVMAKLIELSLVVSPSEQHYMMHLVDCAVTKLENDDTMDPRTLEH